MNLKKVLRGSLTKIIVCYFNCFTDHQIIVSYIISKDLFPGKQSRVCFQRVFLIFIYKWREYNINVELYLVPIEVSRKPTAASTGRWGLCLPCRYSHLLTFSILLPKATPMAMGEQSSIYHLEIDDGRDPSVREYIDNTLTALLGGLSSSPPKALSISLKCRAKRTTAIINPLSGALEARPSVETHRTYFWPGKTAHEAWKFGRSSPIAQTQSWISH